MTEFLAGLPRHSAMAQRIVPAQVIAHRGAPRLAPENTLPSFRAAVSKGATWLEVDVKLTRDLQPVIIHDDRVDRTTNGKGFVAAITLEDIRRLDAGYALDNTFHGVKIPTLEELIEFVITADIGLQLELKPTAGDDVETAEIALTQLKMLWPRNRDRLFISSFSIRSIHAASRILPDVPRAFAVCVPPRNPTALLAETRCQLLHCIGDLLTDDAVNRLADSGIEYAVAVVNDAVAGRRYLQRGAQSLISDIPDLLV
jgi:glycerophosphoryl diester phosphodiesterase